MITQCAYWQMHDAYKSQSLYFNIEPGRKIFYFLYTLLRCEKSFKLKAKV